MTLINKTKFLNDNDFLVHMLYKYLYIVTLRIACSILETGPNWMICCTMELVC